MYCFRTQLPFSSRSFSSLCAITIFHLISACGTFFRKCKIQLTNQIECVACYSNVMPIIAYTHSFVLSSRCIYGSVWVLLCYHFRLQSFIRLAFTNHSPNYYFENETLVLIYLIAMFEIDILNWWNREENELIEFGAHNKFVCAAFFCEFQAIETFSLVFFFSTVDPSNLRWIRSILCAPAYSQHESLAHQTCVSVIIASSCVYAKKPILPWDGLDWIRWEQLEIPTTEKSILK